MTEEDKREVRRMIAEETSRIFHQQGAVPRSIKQRHLEGNLIFTGLAADRPNGSTEVKVYFATDTNLLSIWTGTAWTTHTIT